MSFETGKGHTSGQQQAAGVGTYTDFDEDEGVRVGKGHIAQGQHEIPDLHSPSLICQCLSVASPDTGKKLEHICRGTFWGCPMPLGPEMGRPPKVPWL